jgi:hypothetical protein
MKKDYFLFVGITLIILITASCKDEDASPDATNSLLAEYDIYVTGEASGRAAFWKNGEINYLTEPGVQSTAGAVDASGSDLYILGRVFGANQSALFWKNGEPTVLTRLESFVYSIEVAGVDVYVSYTDRASQSSQSNAKLWKNGELLMLNGLNPDNFSVCFNTEISGSDVHAIGIESINNVVSAKYWKNGELINIVEGSPNYSIFTDISVSGNDVHLVGYILDVNNNRINKYWKNGVEVPLSSNVVPERIVVSGNDVYMVNSQADYYTVNGEKVLLEKGEDAGERYVAQGVQIIDGNVLIAAGRFNSDNRRVGGYVWMNGDLLSEFSVDMEDAYFNGFILVKK